MKIVLAFDSYKGSLSAVEACAAAAEGLRRLSPDAEIIHCPLSDGGEGFAEAMQRAGNGEMRTLQVTGPLLKPTRAGLVLLDGGKTAVVESAQACGLGLIPHQKRSPLRTTSYGLGQMLAQAAAWGAERIVVGLGGSATNDGGMGMLAGLGWRFLDTDGHDLAPVGASLLRVAEIIPGNTLPGIVITAACDVTNPLDGPTGAAHTFAAQKGASPAAIVELDAGLRHYAEVCARLLGHDWSSYPGAGAAGGLGFALLAFLRGQYQSGSTLAITLAGLEGSLVGADLCFTGEGQTDHQTAYGKLPAAVAARAVRADVPCVCLSGALGEGWHQLYACGFTAICSISTGPQKLTAALAHAAAALADRAEACGRLYYAKRCPLDV